MLTSKLVDIYRKLMNIIIIAAFVLLPAAGWFIGKTFSDYSHNYTVAGILLGLLAALIFAFLIMPPILVLFEINEKLKKENTIVKEKTKTETKQEAKPTSWLCKNCGEVNPAESTVCKKCFTNK